MSTQPTLHQPRKRTSKLSPQSVLDLLKLMVSEGASVAEIRSALADGAEGRDPVTVSSTAVQEKIKSLGLQLHAPPVPRACRSPSVEAIEAARRSMSSAEARKMLVKGPTNNPTWLLSFETDIREILGESDLTLAQVWDHLALRFGKISPQLGRDSTSKQKTKTLYMFISREAAKAKRKNKMNWARTYLEVGRHALASAPAKPVDAAVVVSTALPRAMPALPGRAEMMAAESRRAAAGDGQSDNRLLQAQIKAQTRSQPLQEKPELTQGEILQKRASQAEEMNKEYGHLADMVPGFGPAKK